MSASAVSPNSQTWRFHDVAWEGRARRRLTTIPTCLFALQSRGRTILKSFIELVPPLGLPKGHVCTECSTLSCEMSSRGKVSKILPAISVRIIVQTVLLCAPKMKVQQMEDAPFPPEKPGMLMPRRTRSETQMQ